jgi:hypothetical protein
MLASWSDAFRGHLPGPTKASTATKRIELIIRAQAGRRSMQPGDYRSGQSRPSMGSWANPLCFCSILDGTGVPRAGPTVAFIR